MSWIDELIKSGKAIDMRGQFDDRPKTHKVLCCPRCHSKAGKSDKEGDVCFSCASRGHALNRCRYAYEDWTIGFEPESLNTGEIVSREQIKREFWT